MARAPRVDGASQGLHSDKMTDLVWPRRMAFFVCAVLATAISMLWIDAPLAALFGMKYHFAVVETLFGGIVLVAAELLVLGGLLAAAKRSGRAGAFSRTLMLACGASILAYGSSHLLKIVFGRPVPFAEPLTQGLPVFHIFHGDHHSSLPSSHMALLGAFAGVLMQAYPGTRPFLLPLLCLAGAAIVLGNWHYLSDVIVGVALGFGAGSVAGRLGRT
jgi:membrane-associated phospholipid phosphatase